MQSYSRSLIMTAALVVGAAICVLSSAPQYGQAAGLQASQGGQAVDNESDEAPFSFSDPDGQELILEDLSARAAIHGMLSLTELEFRFRNPKAARIEGRFTLTLPPNATISRFAKDVNGHLMEGEVVERLRANQVYEQYLHQMRDPALLEQDQGNRFSVRIFPIEANAQVRLILSYSTLLPLKGGVRTYALPLRGAPKMNHFTFRAFVSPWGAAVPGGTMQKTTVEVLTQEENNYRPSKDINLTWPSRDDAPRSRVLRAGDFYVAALRPNAASVSNSVPHSWLFYIDTSASGAEGAQQRIRALEAVLASLPADDRVELIAFDNDVESIASGTASSMSRTIGDRLRARMFLGGTDLGAAIRHAARAANPDRAIVFVSDLVATLGGSSSADLNAALRSFRSGARVHLLVVGSRRDAQIARMLTAGRGRVVEMMNGRDSAAELRRPVGGSVDVSDSAAEWIYPAHFDDVQPGDEVLVLGKLRGAGSPLISAATFVENAPAAFAPLVEREAYRAYLEYLAEREANEPSEAVRNALGTEQVRISVEQRVVIPRTTMLVLESEFEYQRFGLNRRALSQILTIDAGGIAVVDRRGAELPPVGRPVPMPFPTDAAPRREAGKQSSVVPRTQTITVMAEAPASANFDANTVEAFGFGSVSNATAPALRRDRPVEEKRGGEDWTRHRRPTRGDAERLLARIRQNPREREPYNQLSDILIILGDWTAARDLAIQWQPYDPDNPQVYELLGLAAENLNRDNEAARAFASLIELAPAKPELLQRAGLLLVRVNRAKVAETPLRRALALRPDRANSFRHLALMLWLDGRPEEAARVLESATREQFNQQWYGDVQRVIREELGYVYRSWIAKSPERRSEIASRAQSYNVDIARRDALRVTLAWETDANDVDLHVVDPDGEECFYGHPSTRSGLRLYGDITQGLGPEVIAADHVERGTYHLGVRYFAAGPMGVSRGLVVVMSGSEPEVRVHPFRLVEGGGEIRYVAAINVK